MPERREIAFPETTVPCPHCGTENKFPKGRYGTLCDVCSKVFFRDWQADEVKKE